MIQKLLSVAQTIRKGSTRKSMRKKFIWLNIFGVLDFIPISLYQLGYINHLPEPPAKLFDSDKVNSSKEANIPGITDGPVSLVVYMTNLMLLGKALKKTKLNVYNIILTGNTIGQTAGGAFYLHNMIIKQKKICIYCVTGALINFAAVVVFFKFFFPGNKI